jgi:hypothetical protein
MGQGVGLAVHAHLLLLHRLQERGLGPRRSPVELVDEDDVGEHRSGTELPGAGVGREDRDAGDVGGEQIGVTLDPREIGSEREGEGPGEHRLAYAGDVLDEEMAPRQSGDGRRGQGPGCPEEDVAEVGHQLPPEDDGAVDGRRGPVAGAVGADGGAARRGRREAERVLGRHHRCRGLVGHSGSRVRGRALLTDPGGLHHLHVIGTLRGELNAGPAMTR